MDQLTQQEVGRGSLTQDSTQKLVATRLRVHVYPAFRTGLYYVVFILLLLLLLLLPLHSSSFSFSQETAGHSSGSPGKKPKAVMGTDADLRKLKLNKARGVLRNFGVPEDEVSV